MTEWMGGSLSGDGVDMKDEGVEGVLKFKWVSFFHIFAQDQV
jgi:hypothetical protein